MKRWNLIAVFSFLIGGIVIPPAYAGPSALALGYCGSDFDVCYNFCRINHPEGSFAGDRARVICGLSCFQKRQQCEARAGGIVRSAPQPIAPLPQRPQAVPQQARPGSSPQSVTPGYYSRPGTIQRAPAGVAGSGAAPVSSPPTSRASAITQATSKTQAKTQPKTEKKKSGFLGWFNRPTRTKSVIPGKR